VVKLSGGEMTAMGLPRVALDANFLVWKEAVVASS
jgi:hypothetical protein